MAIDDEEVDEENVMETQSLDHSAGQGKPWIDISKFPASFWKRLNLKVVAVNDRGSLTPNLWFACSQHLDPQIIYVSRQYICCSISVNSKQIFIAAVYACHSYMLRRALSTDLTTLHQNNIGPWCFIGDFNVVMGAHEYRGSGRPSQLAADEFRAWTDLNNLTHIMTRGSQFTWSNGRKGNAYTEKRLDRAICNDLWLDFWSQVSCITLTRSKSDHFPIFLVAKKDTTIGKSSFKFMKMWDSYPDCRNIIAEELNKSLVGCPMYILSQKLKALKIRLRDWNKTIFGDVHHKVSAATSKVDRIQSRIDACDYCEDFMRQEQLTQAELQQALQIEEEF